MPEVVKPTCTKMGYIAYTCSCTSRYYSNYTDPLGHNYDKWIVDKAATTKEEGIQHRNCKNGCGVVEKEAIEKLEGLTFLEILGIVLIVEIFAIVCVLAVGTVLHFVISNKKQNKAKAQGISSTAEETKKE